MSYVYVYYVLSKFRFVPAGCDENSYVLANVRNAEDLELLVELLFHEQEQIMSTFKEYYDKYLLGIGVKKGEYTYDDYVNDLFQLIRDNAVVIPLYAEDAYVISTYGDSKPVGYAMQSHKRLQTYYNLKEWLPEDNDLVRGAVENELAYYRQQLLRELQEL